MRDEVEYDKTGMNLMYFRACRSEMNAKSPLSRLIGTSTHQRVGVALL